MLLGVLLVYLLETLSYSYLITANSWGRQVQVVTTIVEVVAIILLVGAAYRAVTKYYWFLLGVILLAVLVSVSAPIEFSLRIARNFLLFGLFALAALIRDERSVLSTFKIASLLLSGISFLYLIEQKLTGWIWPILIYHDKTAHYRLMDPIIGYISYADEFSTTSRPYWFFGEPSELALFIAWGALVCYYRREWISFFVLCLGMALTNSYVVIAAFLGSLLIVSKPRLFVPAIVLFVLVTVALGIEDTARISSFEFKMNVIQLLLEGDTVPDAGSLPELNLLFGLVGTLVYALVVIILVLRVVRNGGFWAVFALFTVLATIFHGHFMSFYMVFVLFSLFGMVPVKYRSMLAPVTGPPGVVTRHTGLGLTGRAIVRQDLR
jgi:hypothetical protein